MFRRPSLPALILGLILIANCTSQLSAAPQTSQVNNLPTELASALNFVEEMNTAVRNLNDYQCIFHKSEWKNGRQIPHEESLQKWRRSPFSVYMKWIGSEKTNQEILFKTGWNGDKLRAHKGSFPDLTVNLDPQGSTAMADSRHSIKKAGFAETMRLIREDMEAARQDKGVGWKFSETGETSVFGEKVRCIANQSPGGSRYYAEKARICMSLRSKLPIAIQIWKTEDGALRLVEDFGYEACKLNPGLTDKDFDPENPEYKF